MHSTKTEILVRLKRSDGASVDELSSALGLASMTVRQHLTALERDSLVHAEEVRRATGRPHFRFRLTEDGHRHLSAGYDRLVALLVDEAGRGAEPSANGATADDRRRALFRGAAGALADRYRGDVAGLASEERVQRIASILRAHGGFAEWHGDGNGSGYELRDFNCIFRATVSTTGPCDWHDTFVSRLLGEPAVAAPPSGDSCVACCRYIIPTRAATPPENRGSF